MSRDGPAVHRRLQQAALELFQERGYDQTTATEIAARAEVTQRTFFRHFADKRDILFDDHESLQTALTEAIASVPPDLQPLPVLRRAFHVLEATFEGNRAFSQPRQRVIAATPTLREREAGRSFALAAAMALALERRGVEAQLATLAAQVGGAAFNYALAAWLDGASEGLGVHLECAFDRLRTLSAG